MKPGDSDYDKLVEKFRKGIRMHKHTVMTAEECQKEIAEVTGGAFANSGGSTQENPVGHLYGAEFEPGAGMPGVIEPLKKKPGWPKGKKRGPRKPTAEPSSQ